MSTLNKTDQDQKSSENFPVDGRYAGTGPVEGHFTIFTIPKPFEGDAKRIQLNAFRSWRRLSPAAEVVVFGDEVGVGQRAAEMGFRQVSTLKKNQHGTPLLDSAFGITNQIATTPFVVYCNSDVILLPDLVDALQRIGEQVSGEFLAFGRRTDVPIEHGIDFDSADEVAALSRLIDRRGRIDSIVCKDYFVFRRGTFASIPPFAVGRGNWDNWMIHSAKQRRLPVIDLSRVVTAIHQRHGYGDVVGNRWKCYVSGSEAKENERLAGGRRLISGSTPNWILEQSGLRKVKFERLNWEFWRESHRFLRLMKDLVIR